jgi:hypothetical protein
LPSSTTIDFSLSHYKEKIYLSEYFDSSNYLILNKGHDLPFGSIDQILKVDSYYILLDKTLDQVVLYDSINGCSPIISKHFNQKYLNGINAITLDYFTKELYVFDQRSNFSYVYNLMGDSLRKLKVTPNSVGPYYIDGTLVYFCPGLVCRTNQYASVLLYDIKTRDSKLLLERNRDFVEGIKASHYWSITDVNDRIWLWEDIYNEIVEINNTGIITRISLVLPDNALKPIDLNKQFNLKKISKDKFFITNVQYLNDFIFIIVVNQDIYLYYIYNKKSNELIYSLTPLIDDINYGFHYWPSGVIGKKCYFSVLGYNEILGLSKTVNFKYKKYFNDYLQNEDPNPVVQFVYIK